MDAIIQLRDNFSGTLERVTKQAINSHKEMKKLGKEVKSMGKSMESAGSGLTKAITLPIVGLGAAAIKSAIDSETAFAGVRKTVNATEREFEQLQKGFDKLSLRIPIDKNELYAIGEAAGQLGVAKEYILDFSETIANLGVATNMTTDEAASELAKFANITQMSMKDIDKLGSVIVDLGNNTAATESDIVAMGMRLAGAGSQIGLTEAQIMSFSAALSSVGIEAEAGGSAFSKVMVDIQLAVETGSERLSEFSKVAGLTDTEFSQLFQSNPAEALSTFIQGLGDAEKNGMSAIAILDQMGISEVRLRDTLLRATEASDLFKDAISRGTTAWEENVALSKEAAEKYGTTEARIQLLRNQFRLLGEHIGSIFLPYLNSGMDKLTQFAEKFRGLDEGTQKTIIKLAMIAAAIGPALFVFGKITTIVGGGMLKFSAFAKQVKTTGSIMKAIANPATLIVIKIAAIIAIVAAVIAVFVKLYQTNETVRNKIDMVWSAIKSIISSAVGAVKALWETHGNDITSIAQKAWGLFGDIVSIALNLVMGAITVFSGIFSVVWPIIASSVSTAVGIITTVLNGIITIAQGIIDFIVGVFTGNWELAWQGVVGIFKGIFGTIAGIAKNIINGLIGHINGFIKAANKIQIPDDVPGIGGMGVNIPLIPQLAKGTDYWKGGMVQVHERGGEIIDLDSGSRVYPHDKSVQMAREDGRKEATSGKQIVITIPKLADEIVVRKEDDIDTITTKVAKKIVKELEEADMNMA
ncbi:phage tail tape measure protein [Andreesenia angusta]|uniref:phage tail tape measure protein n=1 Tax=Andreesenia angusta TaxID=39480 RepID=UPI001470F612|nr:phage tail tape measure protein [Andreesenia angusta]